MDLSQVCNRIAITFSVFLIAISTTARELRAQQFQPRGSSQTASEPAGQGVAVSQDLLQIYKQTQTAATEADVTEIGRACSKVIPDRRRSSVDREYASSLLAWALNRRGEMRSDRAAELVQRGELNEANKLDGLAADDFKTSIEYGPKNWRTRHNYAISLAMKSDYLGAIEQLSRAIELKPDYANSRFNRGEIYFELGEYVKALRDYSSAIELNETDPQFFNSRGHCSFMLESYDEALADYEAAAKLGTDSAVYQTDLADAYQYLGKWEQAAKAYRAAVAINNQFARAYQNASWLMATCPETKLQNPELAISAARKAIELEGRKTASALDALAAATAASGKHSEAAKLQRQAIEASADEQERVELAQRLRLYEQGQAYVQPQPTGLSPELDRSRIQTASGTTRPRR